MSYTIHKLVDPPDAKLDELRAVFDAAFASDSAFKAVTGLAFDRSLPASNRAQLLAGKMGGEIYVAEDANGKVIGASVWFGPGREIYDSEDQKRLALGPLVEQFPSDVKEWFIGAQPKLGAFKKAAFGDLARAHWYLQRVGTLPEWQFKGVGTALINRVRNNVGGLSISLQAAEPHNVHYYERLGFKVRGHMDINALHGNFTMTGLLWIAP